VNGIDKKPRFTHDCNGCVYLGTYDKHVRGEFNRWDLYWCKSKNENLSSLIARYGDEGHEYRSSHPPEAFCVDYEPTEIERETLARALVRGLYTPWIKRKELEGAIRIALSDLECNDLETARKMLLSTGVKV
jgi:hypothetical protein